MTTVALKGRLTLEEEEGGDKKWHWKGKWTFGTSVVDVPSKNTPKQQPFHYTFVEPADPSTVAVPSLIIPPPTLTSMEEPDTTSTNEMNEKSSDEKIESTLPKPQAQQEQVEEKSNEQASKENDLEEEANNKETKTESEVMQEDKPIPTDKSKTTEKEGTETKAQEHNKTTTTTAPSLPLDKAVSFAAVPEGHPAFTDAGSKFFSGENSLTSGRWKGYFSNTTGSGRNKTTQRVKEESYICLNATPGPGVLYYFEQDPAFPTENKDDRVLVRGMGENAFGTFELVGYMDVSSMELTIQRQYVIVQEEPRHSPKARRKRSPSNTPVLIRHHSSRQSRKRAPSWKLKSQEEDDEEEQDEPYKRKKRPKLTIDIASIGAAGSNDPGSNKSNISTPGSGGKKSIAGQHGGALHPSLVAALSPANAMLGGSSSATNKRRSSQGSSRKKSSSGNGSKGSLHSSSAKLSGSSSLLKLPPTGDPKKARWRAAHFLYYQRHDPDEQEQKQQQQQNSGSTNNNSNNNSNNPKYVIYEGEMADSKREGRGICLYSNNMLYEGEWKRDKEHGKGKLMTADRSRIIYEGEFERGRMQGQGTYYYAQADNSVLDKATLGARYIGEFKENMRNGFGQYFLPDGSIYNGMWREGMMNGKGVFTWPDKSTYDGEWKDGKRHGQGILKTSDGFIYDGMWINNSMEGRGHATYPNGQKYEGLFSKGRREGRGTIIFTNGAVYEGRFRDDAVDGQGTMKMSHAMVVPNEKSEKNDFMIPISFQSDMTHIHTKAGFTAVGE